MANISILKDKCVACKICVSTCPFGAIKIVEGKAEIGELCTLCGSCVEACKFGAINFEKDEKQYVDLSSYKGIWVFAEQRYGVLKTVTLELLGKAKKLAEDLGVTVTAVLIGYNIENIASELIAYGADDVLIMNAPWLNDFNDHVYGELIVELVKDYKPEILLIGATSNGRSLAPYVSATLGTGLTADCTKLEIDTKDRLLLQTRPAFGGNLMATIVCPNNRPQMSTVRPKVFKPDQADYNREGKVSIIPVDQPIDCFVKKIRNIDYEEGSSLADAEIIVSVGKGIGNAKNIVLAQNLANALGGTVAASRPVVDSGWMPYSQQVGQTGKTVSPKIYIACGISGAIQHLAGLADIDTIVAINNDPEAAIFKVAHYGIVGDCREILPIITEKIKANGQCEIFN
jgi:electron transfer flavoprotein alpha subunit